VSINPTQTTRTTFSHGRNVAGWSVGRTAAVEVRKRRPPPPTAGACPVEPTPTPRPVTPAAEKTDA